MIDETDIKQLLAANRPREAFERLVDKFQEKVFHLCLSLTRNEATARDMAQEAFLRVWKGLPGYNGSASLSTWTYAITRNVCLTELKRHTRKQTVPLEAPESAGTLELLLAPDPTEATPDMDIETVLSRLPEKYQQVLRLFYLEQKSYEETAALLGVPVGTIKTNLFRARKELARLAAHRTNLAQALTP